MFSHTLDDAGRLNVFQRVMLLWSSVHPYNATHTFKLAGPPRPDALRKAIRDIYRLHGVGIVHLSQDRRWYRYEPDPEPSLSMVEGNSDGVAAYEALVTREMNRPFPRPTCRPLRFNVVSCDRDFHYVSTTYDHWTADSVALRLVLRGILGRYMDLDLPEAEDALNLYPATYRKAFGHHFCKLKLAAAALRSMRRWNRNRMAWRVACWSNTRWDANYQFFTLAAGTVARLKTFARSVSATVHDVILAALARALAREMPARGRNRGMALGSIVDTRSVADVDLSRSLGAFLSYYLVRCQGDGSQGLAETTRRIAALTGPVKARQGYLDSLINMQVTNLVWPWLSAGAQPHFMRSALPMTGGVSNIVVREPWIDRNRHAILGYDRVAPTGLMLPLVITPTTLGDTMNLGVTYRVTGFTRVKIEGLMATVLEQLERPEAAARKPRRLPVAAAEGR